MAKFISGIYSNHSHFRTKPKRRYAASDNKIAFAKKLFENMTPAERVLWAELHGSGWKAQHILFGWIVDFYHPKRKLVVELDGATHDSRSAIIHDERRDASLWYRGIETIRFRNEQVFNDLPHVLRRIRASSTREKVKLRRSLS